MALPGPLVLLMSVPAYGLLIAGAGRAAVRREKHGRWLDAVAGTLFIALGLRLVLGARPG